MLQRNAKGLTLVELLVVVCVISLLMGILLPAISGIRRQAKALQCMHRQRQIVYGVSLFAADNDDSYPDSVATIRTGNTWKWQDPRQIIACNARQGRPHRALSAFLSAYLPDSRVMTCPSAPSPYAYLPQAWADGDAWDNPETPGYDDDPVFGSYCLYWNYVGYLGEETSPFVGPSLASGSMGGSTLLVSDYFGYNHHRSPEAYGSSEWFSHADIAPGSPVSSDYWTRLSDNGSGEPNAMDITLHAGFTDGHVSTYSSQECIPMRVATDQSGRQTDASGFGPGVFFLPSKSLPQKGR